MQICVLGATGRIGQRTVAEAVRRSHRVTAASRRGKTEVEPGAQVVQVDSTRIGDLERVLRGHDAVICAVGPSDDELPSMVVDTARALAGAAMRSGVRRVVIVGSAGSLAVRPGVELLSTPQFPEEWRDLALAHREALEIWRQVKELEWTYVSPAALVEPGERSGTYRVGHNELLVDEHGKSFITMEDFAVALLDEVENDSHVGERINIAS